MTFRPFGCIAILFSCVSLVQPLSADENRLFILQDSNLGASVGNTLIVDQSLAVGSTVSGALDSDAAATQIGGGNTALVNISNSGGQVALNQINLGNGLGNSAVVDLSGLLATGVISQNGFGNDGSLTVTGFRASGLLEQDGNGNTGSVEISGRNANGELYQVGNNNDTGLQVSGRDASVILTQTGNNITSAPTVVTNGGTVVINQTRSRN